MKNQEKLENFLKRKGFVVANYLGIAGSPPEKNSAVGLLRETEMKKYLGFIKWKRRREFVATIWLEDDYWAVDVNGKGNLEMARGLAEDLMREFGFQTYFRLVTELPAFEIS